MAWDASAVLALANKLRTHGGDFTSIEVKRGTGGCPDLARTLCAFGNLPEGGLIVVGLDESKGFAPVGLADPAEVERSIAAQARTAVTPPVAVSFDTVDVDGALVVLATVEGLPASSRPCRTSGRAYLRQADGDYVMSVQEEQQLLVLRDRPRYDAVPIDGTTVCDLDPRLVEAFVRNVRTGSRRLASVDDQTVLRRRGVVEASGNRLTVGGLYALGQYPQQFWPSLSVTAAVVGPVDSPNRLIDLTHLDGPIPDLLDGSLEWLRRNLRTGVRVGADGHNYDHPELPLPALRELVANALIHRDLSSHTQSKRVEIRLRPDRLVISSPGGLWGVSRQQLGLPGGKSAVNEHLYSICMFASTPEGARIIEGEGGGIGEVQRAMADWHGDRPIFIDKAVSFTAVLMRTQAKGVGDSPVSGSSGEWMSPSTRIMVTLASGPLDRRSIAERSGLSMSQTRYALTKMTKQGQVKMIGGLGARNTVYGIATQQGGLGDVGSPQAG